MMFKTQNVIYDGGKSKEYRVNLFRTDKKEYRKQKRKLWYEDNKIRYNKSVNERKQANKDNPKYKKRRSEENKRHYLKKSKAPVSRRDMLEKKKELSKKV